MILNLIERIKQPRVLRYIYYWLFQIANKTNNSTPKTSVSITLAFTHILQIVFFINLFGYIVDFDIWRSFFTNTSIIFIIITALMFLYFVEIVYHFRDKHLLYIKEFEKENSKQKRSGTIVLALYFIISFSIFFGILYLIKLNSPFYT
ncbi:hypothetical protein SAMN04488096_10734 [Mesonia phycicola]|uniref:Uncharacterized protein n=1 Tax=Mesonia phycicola TaxID=579105 RepID=A0A1M6FZ22_9FLAO|nr:hypothetical protein SAMN04488096_10734 [Mesonia phycicola]